jgi:hypothetical protein
VWHLGSLTAAFFVHWDVWAAEIKLAFEHIQYRLGGSHSALYSSTMLFRERERH